ncbi:MAG: NAD-dependent epimerase/dehydratase family protein [Acidobacteriota bacterium]
MNVLVTGASGFIGRALVKELIHRKDKVSVFLHTRRIPEENLCETYRGDICDSDKLRTAMKNMDVVFHLAASMGASQNSEREFFRINKGGTKAVLKAAKETGVKKCIHFSSAGVLGSVKKNKGVKEDYPPNPISVYDRSKLAGERTAIAFSKQGMDIVVVRPGWVYGPGDKRTFKLIEAISNKKFIFVTGKKTFQTPVYIHDLVNAALLCMEKGQKGEIYHLAGDEVLTVKEMARNIAEAADVCFPTVPLPLFFLKTTAFILEEGCGIFNREAPLTKGRLAFFTDSKPLSISKAEFELGYSPQYDFKNGIRKTVNWYKEKGWLSR